MIFQHWGSQQNPPILLACHFLSGQTVSILTEENPKFKKNNLKKLGYRLTSRLKNDWMLKYEHNRAKIKCMRVSKT